MFTLLMVLSPVDSGHSMFNRHVLSVSICGHCIICSCCQKESYNSPLFSHVVWLDHLNWPLSQMALDTCAIIRVTVLSRSVPPYLKPWVTKYPGLFFQHLYLPDAEWAHWHEFSSLRRKQEYLIPLQPWLGWVLGMGQRIKVELPLWNNSVTAAHG